MSLHLNGELITPTIFPDGTSQIWKVSETALEPSLSMDILFNFENDGEIFQLCQLVELVRHARIPCDITLNMPFLPYGRQDKEVSNENTFALRTFACVINALSFDKVTTVDAHSNVAAELFDNFNNVYPDHSIINAVKKTNINCVAFPDAGASERYSNHFGDSRIIGHKVRNQSTGYIEQYNIEGNPEGKNILIVDDIADGGMTFKLMSKELYKQGAESVHLYVTHGIFSKGLDTLRADGIQRIFTKEGEV